MGGIWEGEVVRKHTTRASVEDGLCTKLALACDEEPDVPRSIQGMIHSITMAGHQQFGEEGEVAWRGYQPISLMIMLGQWRST